jgi:copper chaperone CopZ
MFMEKMEMKKNFLALFVTMLVLSPVAAFACGGEDHASNSTLDSLLIPSAHADTNTPAAAAVATDAQKARIKVAGLHCSSCEKMINTNLNKVNGVHNVVWNKKKNIVEVTYAKGSTTPAALLTAITSAGDDFKATIVQ